MSQIPLYLSKGCKQLCWQSPNICVKKLKNKCISIADRVTALSHYDFKKLYLFILSTFTLGGGSQL